VYGGLWDMSMDMQKARKVYESKVIPVPESGCWLAVRFNGRWHYGSMMIKGLSMGLHRWSWTLFRGPIPDGLFVCHKCDTPQCSNPDHLYLGTPSENQSDSVKRGRQWGPRLKGETNGRAKVTADQVREIRKLPRPIRLAKTAAKYGLSVPGLKSILGGYNWKHVA
jgi:hypothetical protein